MINITIWQIFLCLPKVFYFFSFVLAFSTQLNQTKIFVIHSSFIRTNLWRMIKICPRVKKFVYVWRTNNCPSYVDKFFYTWTNFFTLGQIFLHLDKLFYTCHTFVLMKLLWKTKISPYSTKKPDKWKKHSVSIIVRTTVCGKMCPHLIWVVLSYLG